MDAIDRGDNYLIIGDFNIDWLGNSSHKRRLEEIINDNYFNQLVTVPTRISSNSVSLIDYAVTNVEDVLICVNDKMKISDHESLEIRMPVRNYVDLAGAKTVRMFRYNNNVFRNSLLFGELSNLSSAVFLNEFAKNLTHVIKHSLNSMVVDKNVRPANNDSLWFNNNLKRMKQNKIHLYNLAVWYNNEFHWRNYRRIRNKYRNELKKSKASYINNKINCCTNQKDMWRAIKNHVLKKENSQVEEIEVNGEIISDSQEIAEYLNSFFIKSVKEIAESIPHLPYENIINESQNIAFNFEIIDIPELIRIMKSMNNKKDQNFLNIKMLLDNFDIIGTHIHRLIVESLQTGIFPETLKEACIVPIKKVQNTKNPAEIRPVNMLSTISKLMEKVVYNQLSKHFEDNNILFEIQSGFRKKHSCESLLNLVVSQWKMEMEKKCVVAVFLDLKRAFEVINRDILLLKLEKYGVRGKELLWFRSYLSNRSQRTKCGENISSEKLVYSGVPQGAVLGSLLFLIYVNDLREIVINSKVSMFADDTLVYICGDNPDDCVRKMNEDLKNIEKYLIMNKIRLNINKTKAMILKGETDVNIRIENEIIEKVNEVKYLGIMLDRNLNFKPHFEYVCKKIAKKNCFLRRLRYKIPTVTAVNIYNTTIKPHFEYCSTVLFMGNQQMKERLQKLQNKGMRCILRCHRLTHVRHMLSTLQWLSINQRLVMNALLFIFKIKNGMMPSYLNCYLVNVENVQPYNLRNASDFRLAFSSTNFGQNYIFYKGLKIFNELPLDLKSETNIFIFKRKLITYVKQKF